ncbi:MAG: stage II sporulation protein M [Saprospiraceae bacterium]|nr:stage II sporulation protein M [Saprospiraceae bacterium]
MRETNFIEQNKAKWREFEGVLDTSQGDPDQLNDLFIQVTDDLSYSRSFYPNRSVRVYLNGLGQRIFGAIYKVRRSPWRQLANFWLDELPQLIHESKQAFRLSFFVFVVSMLIGGLSCAMDENFASIILGDEYVMDTLDSIRAGDPMAVYKAKGEFSMSFVITLNNLYVTLLIFVLGAFFSVGSISVLIYNGIMVGAFQYFFIKEGYFLDSFLTIWTHGSIEVSCIVIAGAAGITMGQGLVFPGSYSRMQSFQRTARRGIKILMSIAPLIILAGFIEGFLTRLTETPPLIRASFIAVCFLFMVVYFVWYPRYKARLGFENPIPDVRIPPDQAQMIGFNRIQSSVELFSDAIFLYKKHLLRFSLTSMMAAAVCCAVLMASSDDLLNAPLPIYFDWIKYLSTVLSTHILFTFIYGPFGPYLCVIALATLLFEVSLKLSREERPDLKHKFWPKLAAFLQILVVVSPFVFLFAWFEWYSVFMAVALLPFTGLWGMLLLRERINIFRAFKRAWGVFFSSLGRSFSALLLLLSTGLLVLGVFDYFGLKAILNLLSMVVSFEPETMAVVNNIILLFLHFFILFLFFILLFAGMGLLYYTLIEIHEAKGLRQKLQMLGQSHKIRGLERE